MKLEHLAVWTDDIERMRQFYTTYFGVSCSAKYHNPKRNYTSYFLSFDEDGSRIELMYIPDVPQAPASRAYLKGLAHFAVTLGSREAVNAMTERLRADGFTIASEPRTTGDGYYESAFLDPEGNQVELLA